MVTFTVTVRFVGTFAAPASRYAKYDPSYGVISEPKRARAATTVFTLTKEDGDAVHPKGSDPLSKLSNWQMNEVEGEGVPVCEELEVCVALELGVPVWLELGVSVRLPLGVPVSLLLGVSV